MSQRKLDTKVQMLLVNQIRTHDGVEVGGKSYVKSDLWLPTDDTRAMYLASTVLEDTERPYGVKVQDETCIPCGLYRLAYTPSTRFGRYMLQLYTNPSDYSCEYGGIRFTGIRVHNGSGADHTAGCLLTPDEALVVQTVVPWLDEGILVYWNITRNTIPCW